MVKVYPYEKQKKKSKKEKKTVLLHQCDDAKKRTKIKATFSSIYTYVVVLSLTPFRFAERWRESLSSFLLSPPALWPPRKSCRSAWKSASPKRTVRSSHVAGILSTCTTRYDTKSVLYDARNASRSCFRARWRTAPSSTRASQGEIRSLSPSDRAKSLRDGIKAFWGNHKRQWFYNRFQSWFDAFQDVRRRKEKTGDSLGFGLRRFGVAA